MRLSLRTASVAALLIAVTPTYASLVLTSAGTKDNFTLSTFISGYSPTEGPVGYGPLAEGIATNGNVITGSLLDQKIYVFNDKDGQTLASAVSSTTYTSQTFNPNFAMTTAGGQVYGAQLQGGVYEHFASNGSFTPIPNLQAEGIVDNLGMWGDPVNGHIITASDRGLLDINPITGSFRVINAGLFPDGVTVTGDGTTAYIENQGAIQSCNLATGSLIATFFTGHSPDGTGVISGGNLNGDVIVNDNDGTVGLLDPTKANGDPNQFIIIASGGTRGDFVSPDTSNGTLFLSQNEEVERLSCNPNCSIGGSSQSPEPAPSALFALGSIGLVLGWLRQRKKAI